MHACWCASTIPSTHKYCCFTCNLKGRGDRNRYSVTICISVESSECVLTRIPSSYGQCVGVCCINKVSHCLREHKAAVIQHCSAVSCPRNYRWRPTSSGAGECEHWRVNIWFCQQLELKSILQHYMTWEEWDHACWQLYTRIYLFVIHKPKTLVPKVIGL